MGKLNKKEKYSALAIAACSKGEEGGALPLLLAEKRKGKRRKEKKRRERRKAKEKNKKRKSKRKKEKGQ